MSKIKINDKEIVLKKIRTSKKGANVDGARVHVDGLGTVYVQVYEPQKAVAHARPPLPKPSDTVELVLETLIKMSERVRALETSLAPILPSTAAIPNPRPSA